MWLSRCIALILSAVILFVAGCKPEKPDNSDGTIKITDDLDRTVVFSRIPDRIVSLAPSFTETLYALAADSQLIGVTRYCNYPPAAMTKKNIGDLLTPDIEGIVALEPDLVLMSVEGNSQQTFTRLLELGIQVFVSNPRDLDGVLRSIDDIAKITGHQPTGRMLLSQLQVIRDSVRERRPDIAPSVLVLLSLQPIITAGRETFINELIETAGGMNVAGELSTGYPVLGRENVLMLDPDIILLSNDLNADRETLTGYFPEWVQLKALRKGRLHYLNADLLTRPGPRLFRLMEKLNMYFHNSME